MVHLLFRRNSGTHNSSHNLHSGRLGKNRRVECSRKPEEMHFPINLNGLSLGTVGLGILWLNFSRFYDFKEKAVYFSYSTSIVASMFLLGYIIFTVLPRPIQWWSHDINAPRHTSACGAITMTISLLAVIANLESLQLHYLVPFTLSLLGAVFQLILMIVFIYQCICTRTLPEPFYNAAVHAITFNTLAVPGNSYFSILLRDISLYIAMILLPLSSVPQLHRVIFHGAARDPSAALLQSGKVSASLCFFPRVHPFVSSTKHSS